MQFIKLAQKNRQADISSYKHLYDITVVRAIRQRYSVNDELAILRRRDEKPEAFNEYNAFVESVKEQVREQMGMNPANEEVT